MTTVKSNKSYLIMRLIIFDGAITITVAYQGQKCYKWLINKRIRLLRTKIPEATEIFSEVMTANVRVYQCQVRCL